MPAKKASAVNIITITPSSKNLEHRLVKLPDVVRDYILTFLDLTSFLSLNCSSKWLHDMIDQENYFKSLCDRNWRLKERIIEDETWLQTYKVYSFFVMGWDGRYKRRCNCCFELPLSKEKVNSAGWPMIAFAVAHSRIDMVEWLVEKDLYLEEQLIEPIGSDRETLTHLAVRNNDLPVLKWLFSIIGDASFGTNDANNISPFKHSRWFFDKLILKWFILNSKPGAHYLKNDGIGTLKNCLTDMNFNYKVVIRRWATFALAQKTTPKKKKMLQWAIDTLNKSTVGDFDNWNGGILADYPDWEIEFRAVGNFTGGGIDAYYENVAVDYDDDNYDDDKDKYVWRSMKKEAIARATETDPLMKIWLPPLGHRWESTNGQEVWAE